MTCIHLINALDGNKNLRFHHECASELYIFVRLSKPNAALNYKKHIFGFTIHD